MTARPGSLVLLRHGQSTSNAAGRFTGWQDVPLTEQGRADARRAGRLLCGAGPEPQVVHTSLLSRAIESADLVLAELDRRSLPVERTWRLNERHYGALTGLSKASVRSVVGESVYRLWRNSLTVAPPAVATQELAGLPADLSSSLTGTELVPTGESIGDVVRRVLPWWLDSAVPQLRRGLNLLVVAHGNSLRALICHLDGLTQDELDTRRVAVGLPLRYDFDEHLSPLRRGGQPVG
ncbi:MAG: 2,3-bisphosphoglycerate-dependent phosphoglycerate mutase [Motilibacteraceae bacterium]